MLAIKAKITDIKPVCHYDKKDGTSGRKIVFYVEVPKPTNVVFTDKLAMELCGEKIDQYNIEVGQVYNITYDCYATEFHTTDYHNRLVVHTMKPYIEKED